MDRAKSEDIREWIQEGLRIHATHLMVVCDTFSYEDYPVYVGIQENVRDKYEKYHGANMQRVMEVYALHLDLEAQLKERMAMHFDTPPSKTPSMGLCLFSPNHSWHLTIIHAKVAPPEELLRLGTRPLIDGPMTCKVLCVEIFGPPERPVRAAVVENTPILQLLRARAESRLIDLGISWSQEWAFNPHVTLIGGETPPEQIIFTHIGWS